MVPSIALHAAPRLMSPIQFPTSDLNPSSFLTKLTAPPTISCNTTVNSLRRNTSSTSSPISSNHHNYHRKHSCPRPGCRLGPAGASFFDSLPWISALDQPHHNLADIADLSMVATSTTSAVSEVYPRHHQKFDPPSLSGPVRRRRTSSRSSPLAALVHVEVPRISSTSTQPSLASVSPSISPTMGGRMTVNPSTPRSRSRDRKDLSRPEPTCPIDDLINDAY